MTHDWAGPYNRQPFANNFMKPAFALRLVSIVWTPGRVPGRERCLLDNWIRLGQKFMIVGADRGDEEIMIRSALHEFRCRCDHVRFVRPDINHYIEPPARQG